MTAYGDIPQTEAPATDADSASTEPAIEPTTVEDAPAELVPVEQAPVEETPADEADGEASVVELSPAEDIEPEGTPAESNAVEETLAEPNAVEETPAEPNAVEETPAEPNAAEETLAEPNAAEETLAEPNAVEEAPADPSPAEAAPSEPPSPAQSATDQAPPEPRPAPRPMAPRPIPTPSALRPTPAGRPASAAPSPAVADAARPQASTDSRATAEPWGRVDDDGTVSVREGSEWRVVGEYPDGTPQEAMAYFERKYADLASEVALLEARHRRAGASASDLRGAVKSVRAKVTGASAVGDLAALEARIAALGESLTAASATEAAAAKEATDEAVGHRAELVEKAEALAAKDPRATQWKQTSAELADLFDKWQAHQQNGPRLPKSTAQALWKRFRDARATVDKHRREFYAELDDAHKSVRDRKTRLVERAEALAPRGEDGIAAYRDLLDEWKTAGRAGKKADDALWARFKAAGDALYAARVERENADAEASREKIESKRALLVEARTIADVRDLARARAQLTAIQRRWDDIGRIFPREKERTLDDEMRKIEQGVRGREDVDWKRNDPETTARANDMTRQLTEAIQNLEAEVAAAERSGDRRAITTAQEALDARRGWLRALGG